MVDLYAWAYLRSCAQYGVVKQSLGEIDMFRIQYRQQRKEVMGQIVKSGLYGDPLEEYFKKFCENNGIDEHEKFIAMTLADLSTLHAGAIIGLGITEAQLDAWLAGK